MATRAELVSAYLSYFGRPPDFDGLKFYENIPFADVISNFSKSPESVALYGATFGAAQVNAIYQNLFNRDAEPAGLDYWSGRVNSGALSAAAAAYGIMLGAQNADKTSVDNKIAIINLFESKLDTAAEITGYGGAAAAASARAYIKTVDSTAASVTSATTGADAAVAAAVAQGGTTTTGLTLTLSTNVETSTATANDIVNGVIATGASTFQTGDVINAAKIVNITGANAVANTATVKNVGTINVTDLVGVTLSADLYSSVANIVNDGTGSLTVTNGELATVYGVKGTGDIAATIRASNISGTADAIKFSVNGAGSLAGTTAGGFTLDVAALSTTSSGVEVIEVATSGTNLFSVTGATTLTTDSAQLKITGSGANTITASAMTNATTFDLSTSTGTNALNLGGSLATGMTIKGGTGADTLRIAPATTAANVTVTGVETLRLSTGSTTGSTTFATAPNFTTVRIDGDAAEAGVQTLNTVGAFTKLSYVGAGSTALSGSQQQFNGLTVNNSFTGSSDTLDATVANGGTTLTAGIGYGVNAMTLGGVETLTITATDVGSTGALAIANITGTTLSSIKVTTPGNVTLGTVTSTVTGGTGSLSSLDLSGVTGSNASTFTLGTDTVSASTVITGAVNGTTITAIGTEQAADSIVFTGNTGVDQITGTGFLGTLVADGKAGNDIFVGGAGADTLTGGEGIDTITGAGGNDSIILTETVVSVDKVTFTGGATTAAVVTANGRDTITGFGTTDTINVGTLGDGTTTATGLTTAAVGAQAALTDDIVLIVNANGTAASLTTAGTATLATADFTAATLTNVAAFLSERYTTTNDANQENVIVWNVGTTTYVYHVDTLAGGTTAIAANEIALVGVITQTAALTTANIVYA